MRFENYFFSNGFDKLYFEVQVVYVLTEALKQYKRKDKFTTVFTRLDAAAFIELLVIQLRRKFGAGVFSRAAFIHKSLYSNRF